jgi:predicted ATPase
VKTLDLLVTWLRTDAERQPVRVEFEDLHWADPSTLEFLTLLAEQTPTMRALLVLTFRPEFTPPWPSRAYILPLHLDRLPQSQIVTLAEHVAGKSLPAEVVEHMVTKTDGVPLFVEELTKTVVESGQLQETEGRYELASSLQQMDIPATLQDSLRARLDRLNAAQDVAQVGATIGREFSHELVQAVSGLEDTVLEKGLRQLVEADLVFQKGLPPLAQYVFKHALVQDTAYQSLLKSRRQQIHTQTAHVLEQQFPETVAAQPELLAHHYTEAGVPERALPYWQQAGQKAASLWNNPEAISHLSRGLALLKTLPATPDHIQQELMLHIMLGMPFAMTRGWGAPEVEQTYSRAQELCQYMGETPQLFPAIFGLCLFHEARAAHQKALTFAEQCLHIAENVQDSELLLESYCQLGWVLTPLAEFRRAREYFARGIALYDFEQHHALGYRYGIDPGTICRTYDAVSLWHLGYPDQAMERAHDAFALSQRLVHPFSQTWGLITLALIHSSRREGALAQDKAEAAIAMATEKGLMQELAISMSIRACAVIHQGKADEGIPQLDEAMAAYQATGTRLSRTNWLVVLADAYRQTGQAEHGLAIITEALTFIEETDERWWEAEVHRVKGELVLIQGSQDDSQNGNVSTAVNCFQTALNIARRQEARSLELRAATSLARLWQQQDKIAEARDLLASVYHWFTEGFDTTDLKDAKALLNELAEGQ